MSTSTSPIGSNSRITSKYANSEFSDLKSPLWAYVKVVNKNQGGGGNKVWTCNFCSRSINGSYSRVRGHLLKISGSGVAGCMKVNADYLAELQNIDEEASKSSRPIHVPLPTENRSDRAQVQVTPSYSSLIGKRRKLGPLEESYTFAANNSISSYIPPGYNALRTTLLQQKKVNVEKLLEPIKGLWSSKGVSIVADGWTDSQRRPLINFMAASEGGPVFLKAIDISKEYKDKHYIANLMKDVINEVGAAKVVQIITDNAVVCKAAGMLIEAIFPHIYWTPCVVHTLNLALKNICAAKNTEKNQVVYKECNWISHITEDVQFIRNFIMNHSMRLAIFNVFFPLKLLAIAETRFASVIVILKRFKLIKRPLQEMVTSSEWSSYKEDNVGKALTVKELILDDLWWDKIDYIVDFTDPIYDMLRFCDTDASTLHLVYDIWDTMIEKVKTTIYRHERRKENEHSSFYDVVYSILIDRWTKINTPLHCLAHSLNPKYYSVQWLQGALNRVPPHRDDEISAERNKCFRRYFPNREDRTKVAIEFSRFSSAADVFSCFDSVQDMWQLDPKSWWVNYGSSAPLLKKLALKLLVQPCSSSYCERNWSTYSFIHSIRRNKMNPTRAEDLVYVHTNLRLLSRRCEAYKVGDNKWWDVGGDAFETCDNGAGILEVADLSLDEPDL